MQELFDTWWYGFLVIPLLITVFVGGLLAFWTSVVMSRYVAFDAARMRASRVLSEIIDLPNSATTPRAYGEAKYSVSQELLALAGEFVRLRQFVCASMMQHFVMRLQEGPWIDPPDEFFPVEGDEHDELVSRIRPYARTFALMMFNARPLIYPLITVQRSLRSDQPIRQLSRSTLMAMEQAETNRMNRNPPNPLV